MTGLYGALSAAEQPIGMMLGSSMWGVDPTLMTLGQASAMLDSMPSTALLGLGLDQATIGQMANPISTVQESLLGLGAESAAAQVLEMLNQDASLAGPTVSSMLALDNVALDARTSVLATAGGLFDKSAASMAILGAQGAYAEALNHLSSMEVDLSLHSVAKQASLFSSTLADITLLPAFASLGAASASLGVMERDHLLLPAHLSSITSSLHHVFADEAGRLSRDGDLQSFRLQVEQWQWATVPVANYARGTRYHWQENPIAPSAPHIDLGDVKLDAYLERLDPDLVRKRQGAWLAVSGDNPDRLSQAAGSYKNLILQVLRRLVPDEPVVDPTIKGSKIRARVKQIMGGSESEADFVLSVAAAVVAAYQVYNKYDHTNQKDELALRSFLQAGDALLYMVLIRLN
jgi:hypothetical protein